MSQIETIYLYAKNINIFAKFQCHSYVILW